MTRRSKRELERALDALRDSPDLGDDVTDADLGVTAEFVTYEADVDADDTEAQFRTARPGEGDR
jgi:hypothetical protein